MEPFALLLSDDMIFTSRITGTAHSLGLTVQPARTIEALEAAAQRQAPSCIIVDLSHPGLMVADLITRLKQTGRPLPCLIAYGSHIDTATLKAAQDAGCDLVLPRSKFVEELPRKLPEWLAAHPPRVIGAHHTSFSVADLERSLAFFRDDLGLEVVSTREVRDDYFGQIVGLPGAVVKAALLRIPNSAHHVELFQYLEPAGTPCRPRPCDPGSSHLAFLVDDLPALYEKLRHQDGVEFVSDPVLITAGPNRGLSALYLRDPNGILIELIQPAKQKS